MLLTVLLVSEMLIGQQSPLANKLLKTKHLIALWDFKEVKGEKRKSLLGPFELSEIDGQIERMEEGPLSGYSAKFGHGACPAIAVPDRANSLGSVFNHRNIMGRTERQKRMARGLVRGLIDQLAASADPQVQALADLYVSEEDTLEAAQEQAEAAQRLRERIEEALGQPIENPSYYQTPEEMMQAGMRQWQRQQEANEERKAAKRAARKAQKQAQKKSAAAENGEVPPAMGREADAKSAIRTIYRQLASALHPDREPDEQERLRKTGLMSEVNAAYEKNDLTTLLRLQMQVTQVNPQSTARMADDKLIAMALLLKEQVAALEDDLDQLQSRLSRELCVPVLADADEAVLSQSLQRIQADQRHSVDSLAGDLRRAGVELSHAALGVVQALGRVGGVGSQLVDVEAGRLGRGRVQGRRGAGDPRRAGAGYRHRTGPYRRQGTGPARRENSGRRAGVRHRERNPRRPRGCSRRRCCAPGFEAGERDATGAWW